MAHVSVIIDEAEAADTGSLAEARCKAGVAVDIQVGTVESPAS
jgi:hypothetical protein